MKKSVQIRLKYFYERNGNSRTPNLLRRKNEGQLYKKGYEIRLVAKNETELEEIRELLISAKIFPGKPYSHGSQFVQPIYGKQSFEKFNRTILEIKEKIQFS